MKIGQGCTLRATVIGLLIGIHVNLSNTYYGLQVGVSYLQSSPSALLGYIIFKSLRWSISKDQNVLISSVATATGCMPITAGFTGIIPAIEYLLRPEDGGPLRLSALKLIVWSIGVCLFGLLFASSLWSHFIVREKLPWPGASATATLMNALHDRPGTALTAVHDGDLPQHGEVHTEEGTVLDDAGGSEDTYKQAQSSALIRASVGSGIMVCLHALV